MQFQFENVLTIQLKVVRFMKQQIQVWEVGW